MIVKHYRQEVLPSPVLRRAPRRAQNFFVQVTAAGDAATVLAENPVSGLGHDLGLAGLVARSCAAMLSAEVAINVRGHKALAATPREWNSAAVPSASRVMPYFDTVYAGCLPNQYGFRLSGGDRLKMWGFAARSRCGRQACVQTKLPRTLMSIIKSYRLSGVSRMPKG